MNQHIVLHVFPPFLPFPMSRTCEEKERHKIKQKKWANVSALQDRARESMKCNTRPCVCRAARDHMHAFKQWCVRMWALASEEGNTHSNVFVRRGSCGRHCCSVRRKISPCRRRWQKQQEWTVVLSECCNSGMWDLLATIWGSSRAGTLVPVTCCPPSPRE